MKPSVRLPAGPALAALLLMIVCAAVVRHDRLAAQSEEPAPVLEIVSPTADAYISGATTFRAAVTPPGAASRVLFSVDGRQVCETSTAPYECSWEAGRSITAHQVRAVAELVGGGRIIRTVRTRDLGYAEKVDVEIVQVVATVVDSRGHFVTGLPKSAFSCIECGRAPRLQNSSNPNIGQSYCNPPYWSEQ